MPSNIARDLLRTAVLETNPYWPFSHCNRWPYAIALSMLVRAVRSRPEIRSLYLRRIPPERDWIPGLSDIDLALVIKRGMTTEQEYDTLESFWKMYGRVKRVLPMLGEVEILDEEEVSPWLAWTVFDPRGPSWTFLHGQRDVQVASAHSTRWRRRALNTALWLYVSALPPCLAQRDSSLRDHDIQRRVRKILRLLEPILAEAGQLDVARGPRSADPVDWVTAAVKALEAAIRQMMARSSHRVPRAAGRDSVLTRQGSPGQTILVTNDGLESEAIAQRLRTGPHGSSGCRGDRLVLPQGVLAYLVRHFDPRDYANLAERSELLDGPPPLADIPPPGPEEFSVHAMDRLANLPIFTRGEELFSHPLSVTFLRQQLDGALAAVSLLRSDGLWPPGAARDEQRRGESAQSLQVLEQVEALLRDRRVREARKVAFGLFRSVWGNARDLMVLGPPEESFGLLVGAYGSGAGLH